MIDDDWEDDGGYEMMMIRRMVVVDSEKDDEEREKKAQCRGREEGRVKAWSLSKLQSMVEQKRTSGGANVREAGRYMKI